MIENAYVESEGRVEILKCGTGKKANPQILLRWYGTPCNIFKDDRILKNNYNHGFKNFKIYNICPKNPFIKFHKRDKK